MGRRNACPSASPENPGERQDFTVTDDWPESLPITREELEFLKCHMSALIADMLMAEQA